MFSFKALAGIQYAGFAGTSQSCLQAVFQIIQYGKRIESVKILSANQAYCLLMKLDFEELVAIKSGFRSGYAGEGPSTFSKVLGVLYALQVEMDEYEVSPQLIERLDRSALTIKDLEFIEAAAPVRPRRLGDYVLEEHWPDDVESKERLFQHFRPVIPLALLDGRLTDLALSFWDDPDRCLVVAYRRLEDIVRNRTGLEDHGVKLFAQAFQGGSRKLEWAGIDSGEQTGRASLFSAAYLAYRNPRAHREIDSGDSDVLAELLLVNQLYRLERMAVERLVDVALPSPD